MGEAKRRETAVREQVVQGLGLQTAGGRSKSVGMRAVKRRRKDRWRFSSSFW